MSGIAGKAVKNEAVNGLAFFDTDEAVLKLLCQNGYRQRGSRKRTVISCSATSLNCSIIPVKKFPAVGNGLLWTAFPIRLFL